MMEYIIHNLFSTEAGVVWLVLKWALVVLAAGFIGQFGKAFATYLIRRSGEGKRKEKDSAPAVVQEAPPPAVREGASIPAGTRPAPVAAADEAVRDAGVQESGKALKARQKAEKKAAKAIKKLFK